MVRPLLVLLRGLRSALRSHADLILEIADLSEDDRFATYWARFRNRDEFAAVLEDALAAKTTAEWLELMEEADLFAAPVNSMDEAFSDAAVAETPVGVDGGVVSAGPPV